MANERGQRGYQQQMNQNDDLLGPDPMQPQIMTAQGMRQSQTDYKGTQHSDLVEITIEKDGDYLKAGEVLLVHPTSAMIFKYLGLISNLGKPYTRPVYENKDITVEA